MKTRLLMIGIIAVLSLLIPQVWGADLKRAEDLRDFDGSFSIYEKQVRYDVPYKITNGTINDMKLNCDSASIVLYITSVDSGIVHLDVPQRLLGGIFMVLVDGNEWDDLSITQNVLSVNFPQNTNSIEIRGSTYITPYYVGSHLYTGVCDIAHDPPYSFILSPLKQINLGIPFSEIQCKDNLVLIQKYDGSPACVTEQTKTKLIERGWGNKTIAVQNSDFVISYSVTKGELISAMANLDTQSLVLDVQMIDDGNMTVKLPRGLIDSINNGKDEVFTVLVEGKKVEHNEQNTQNHRILNFPLLSSETGSVIVEIIPFCPSWRCDV